MVPLADIDISENKLRRKGKILDTLLLDRTTGRNIIWATDSYAFRGKEFGPKKQIKPELVTDLYSKLIQPRAAKSLEEQKRRTKEKAEVFTPKRIVEQMNKSIDWKSPNWPATAETWQEYVKELRLEISAGEAPYIVTRYNPTAHTGKVIDIANRVGFLDRKLHVVSEFCDTKKDWLHWAKEAYKASYGYEWQGDNVLLARENLFETMIDYYKAKFQTDRAPSLAIQQELAEIISWNIWQMDGIKYVVPMSCHNERKLESNQQVFAGFEVESDQTELFECEGCKFNRPTKHNGKYTKVMDWSEERSRVFIDIVTKPTGPAPKTDTRNYALSKKARNTRKCIENNAYFNS